MSVNLRDEARRMVDRAKAELASGDESRLRYAALELRLAMEALTYDRARAYKDEVHPAEYETWQPRRVLDFLLEIDPMADKGSTLKMGVEEEYGKPAPVMSTVGSEQVLSLSALKEHYGALGSYLHMLTWKQLSEGKQPDLARLQERCAEIITLLDGVLASTVYNMVFGGFSTAPCSRCAKPVRKRMPIENVPVTAQCFHCGAAYEIRRVENNQVVWKPLQEEVTCPVATCAAKSWIWQDRISVGKEWTCVECGVQCVIVIGYIRKPESDASA